MQGVDDRLKPIGRVLRTCGLEDLVLGKLERAQTSSPLILVTVRNISKWALIQDVELSYFALFGAWHLFVRTSGQGYCAAAGFEDPVCSAGGWIHGSLLHLG